jgi:SAM-dependent methyltransferase
MTDRPPSSPVTFLPFTGERFTPECVREIWYEHWHRYAFVLPLARGRRVLDGACGEGYGSAILATIAAHVTGMDVDGDTIEHARQRYDGIPHLSLERGSVTDIQAEDDSFDLIVSFETIEHLADQERMLDEFRRVLAPDGILAISSPDRIAYNEGGAAPNPFHVRELDRGEFVDLLSARFPAMHLFGQKLGFHSLIWQVDTAASGAESLILDPESGSVRSGFDPAPVYHVAICAAEPALLPDLAGLSLFADEQSSVYSHYNAEIERLIRADHRIIALEREVAALRAALHDPS